MMSVWFLTVGVPTLMAAAFAAGTLWHDHRHGPKTVQVLSMDVGMVETSIRYIDKASTNVQFALLRHNNLTDTQIRQLMRWPDSVALPARTGWQGDGHVVRERL